LGIFRARLFSRGEYLRLFLMCLFPVNVWAIVIYLRRIDAIALLMSTANLLVVTAYVLGFALLESLAVFMALFLVSLIIPRRWLEARLVPVGAAVILMASISAALVHLYDAWDITWVKFDQWTAIWVSFSLIVVGLLVFFIVRYDKIKMVFQSGVDRLSVLSLVYLSADVLGLLVVLVRNLVLRLN
jgi:hypothetical protein